MYWNEDDGTLNLGMPGGEVNLQIGQEMLARVKNDTVSQIDNGTPVYISGADGTNITIAPADADFDLGLAFRTFAVTTEDIPAGQQGYVTTQGFVRDIDTSAAASVGVPFYLAVGGGFTSTIPTAPDVTVFMAFVTRKSATVGEIYVIITSIPNLNSLSDVEHTSLADKDTLAWDATDNRWENRLEQRSFFNGTFRETIDALNTSNGTTITMTLTNAIGGDLTMQFSDGDTVFSASNTIALTPGATDDAPQVNYIYILQSDKILTKSTVSFPTDAEHIKVGFFFASTASKVQADGGTLINQNWNDHLANGNDQGHMSHMAEQNRYNKGYFSGVDPNGTDQSANTSYFHDVGGSNAFFKSTAGLMYQLHRHVIPLIDTQSGGDDIHVANWFEDNYHEITDLTDITADSLGGSLSNRFFNVFFFSVGNKTDEYAPLMAMVPSGSYVTDSGATNDTDNFNNVTMPREFGLDSSVGVPICLMTMKWSGGLGTLTHISTRDLRQGGGAGGSGQSGSTDFADNQFTIFDADDITNVIDFDAGSTGGATRTITMPPTNVDLADIATNTNLLSATPGTAEASKALIVDADLNLDIGFGDRTNVGDYDGSVDATANADAGTVDAQYSFEAVLTELNGGTALTPKVGSVGIFFDRGSTKALCSNGTEFYEAVAYVPQTGNGARAVSFMFKIPDGDAASGVLWQWGDTGSATTRFDFAVINGALSISFRGSNITTSQSIWNDGLWHHCLATHDGVGAVDVNGTKIIVDGVNETYTGTGIGVTLNTGSVALTVMSRSAAGSVIPPDGWCLDELTFYKTGTLPDITDAQNIYNRQKTKFIGGSTGSATDWTLAGNAQSDFGTAGSVTVGGSGTFGGDVAVGSLITLAATTGDIDCVDLTATDILATDITTGGIKITAALNHDGSTVGFYGTTPVTKQTLAADPTNAGISTVLRNLGLTELP
jgi:hypothetical protein